MTRTIPTLAPTTALLFLLSACGVSDDDGVAETDTIATTQETTSGATAEQVLAANATVHDPAALNPGAVATTITLTGGSATVDGEGAEVADGVVTITTAGTYSVSGELTDGGLVVAAGGEDDVLIVLDGAAITHTTGSAIQIIEAAAVTIELAAGSTNTVADGTDYTNESTPTAAVASDVDLSITGTGTLTVRGFAEDGIASSDGLVIADGTLMVTAVDDGVRGKHYLAISGGMITVAAGGDGLISNEDTDATDGFVLISGGELDVAADGDAVQAETDVVVSGGTLSLTAGGGPEVAIAADASAKGLKGVVSVIIDGGDITISAADDAVHSNQVVAIHGGTLTVASGDDGVHADAIVNITGGTVDVTDSYEGLEANAIIIAGGDISVVSADDGVNAAGGEAEDDQGDWSGLPGSDADSSTLTITGGTVLVYAEGDGIDVNGSVTMSGGTVVVHGPARGANAALDYDSSFDISGGTLVALGTTGMVQTPGTGGQGWISTTPSSGVQAGTVVQVADADGTALATIVADKSGDSVIVSMEGITEGEDFQVLVGGSPGADAVEVGGFSLGGDTSGASVDQTVTAGQSSRGRS